MSIERVGTVEILRTRIYPIDSETPEPRIEVIVEPGEAFPLLCEDGWSYFWLMTGKLQGGGLRSVGDALILGTPNDVPIDVTVTFPSKRLGPDEWRALLDEPVFCEGDPEQRLRVTFT